jgi:hypothetical protein
MNGMWLVPSRKRPHNLKRFFAALQETRTSTVGYVLVNESEFEDATWRAEYLRLAPPPNWSFVLTRGDSQGDKLREVEDLYRRADWIGLLGDDQVPLTSEWDRKLLARVLGWNLVSCYDDNWQINERGGRIAGTILWSGDLYRAIGYLFPPGMHHVYIDDYLEELGQLSGCWSFAEQAVADVVIAHLHYTRKMSDYDETYKRAYETYGDSDNSTWQQWRANELGAAVERVKTLINNYARVPSPI